MSELLVPSVNFGILLALLAYFVWPAFKRSVAERRESIRKYSEQARLQKIEAEKKYREFEIKLNTFESEAQSALARATEEAARARAAAVEMARESAGRLKSEAEQAISANAKEIIDELRGRVVRAAVDQARKILQEKVSQEVQSKIVKDYVEKVQ